MATLCKLGKLGKLPIALAAAVLAGLLAPPAMAVVIQETFDPLSGQGEYTVVNDSGFDIFAFAVRNDSLMDVSLEDSDDRLAAWEGFMISRDEWDNDDVEGWPVFANLPSEIDPPTLGSFETLFGPGTTEDSFVAFYLLTELDPGPTSAITTINPGMIEGGFLFESDVPASPFVVFGVDYSGPDPVPFTQQGQTQLTSAIPEPAALSLHGAGLALLAFFAGRKRKYAAA